MMRNKLYTRYAPPSALARTTMHGVFAPFEGEAMVDYMVMRLVQFCLSLEQHAIVADMRASSFFEPRISRISRIPFIAPHAPHSYNS